MSPRYVVHTDTEGGYVIGYTVWDTQEQRVAASEWASARHGWTRADAEAEAARLNREPQPRAAAGRVMSDAGEYVYEDQPRCPYCGREVKRRDLHDYDADIHSEHPNVEVRQWFHRGCQSRAEYLDAPEWSRD